MMIFLLKRTISAECTKTGAEICANCQRKKAPRRGAFAVGLYRAYMVTKINFSTNRAAMMVTIMSFFWYLPVQRVIMV